jgi:hypothetical protein
MTAAACAHGLALPGKVYWRARKVWTRANTLLHAHRGPR